MSKWIAILFLSASIAGAADNCSNLPAPAVLAPNGLEQTPVMGYSTWYDQYTSPTEAHIKAMADFLVSSGLAAAGYNTIEISEGWQGTRVGSAALPANSSTFPDGLSGTIAYIHSKGLKASVYTSPYLTSCAGFNGSGTFEQTDANMFAAAGADRLEYDGCSVNLLYPSCWLTSGPQVYQYMAQFIRATGRPMQMMIGTSGAMPWEFPQAWAKDAGFNEWRILLLDNNVATDINGDYTVFNGNGGEIDQAAGSSTQQVPGFFGHCDYLMATLNAAFMHNFTAQQTQTQFQMCAMWGGPLLLSMDLTTLTSDQLGMFQNADIVAVDKDALGKMATRYSQTAAGSATTEIWVKTVTGGKLIIGMLNRDSAAHSMTVNFAPFGGSPTVKDITNQVNLGVLTSYTTTVAGQGSILLRLTPPASGTQSTNGKIAGAIAQ